MGRGRTVSIRRGRKLNLTTLASINVSPPTGQAIRRHNSGRKIRRRSRWARLIVGGRKIIFIAAPTAGQIDRPTAGHGLFERAVDGNGGLVVQGWSDDLKIDPFNSNHLFFHQRRRRFFQLQFHGGAAFLEFGPIGIEEMVYCMPERGLPARPARPQLFSVFGDIAGFAHYNVDVSPRLRIISRAAADNYGIDFAELNPNLVVRTFYNNPGCSGYFSTNAGSTWTEFVTEPAAADERPRSRGHFRRWQPAGLGNSGFPFFSIPRIMAHLDSMRWQQSHAAGFWGTAL